MQAKTAGGAPQTACLLGFQGGSKTLLPGGDLAIRRLFMPLHPLLNENAGHVADRARFLIRHGRQTGTEILRKDHLDPRGLGLPAGGRLTGGHDRISKGSLSYPKVYRGGQG